MQSKSATAAAQTQASGDETTEDLTAALVVAVDVEDEE